MLWMLWTCLGGGTASAADLLAMAKPAGALEWGYVDVTGAFVIPAQYRKVFPFSDDGFAPIYQKEKKSFAFLDPTGKTLDTELKKFELKNVMGFGSLGFDEGLAPVQVSKKWGYLGTDGKLVIQPKYDRVSRFDGGAAWAKIGKQLLILDKAGKETEVQLKGAREVRHFHEGLAPVKSAESTWGFVDPSGSVVIEPQFKAVGYFVDGLAWAKTSDGVVGYINKKGGWAIKPTLQAAEPFGPGSGLARAKSNDVWAFIKTDGSQANITKDVDGFKDFHEGLCKGKIGTVYGFFNTQGKWVIKPQFEGARNFKNGHAAVKSHGQWGFINASGKWVVEAQFDGLRDLEKTAP